MKKFILSVFTLCSFLSIQADIIWVTNINNNGAGTLREAIYEANYVYGPDTIFFNIPGAGPHTIILNGDLPAIDEKLFIDGFSQPGSKSNSNNRDKGTNAEMKIELKGAQSPGPSYYGLIVYGVGTKIQGLVINNFNNAQIAVYTHGVIIQGNYIGINAEGTNAVGESTNGILFQETSNCLLGGSSPNVRNVIAGCSRNVRILSSSQITVSGNYIGVNAAGTQGLESFCGIDIIQSNNTTIGGDMGNLISGHYWGIKIEEGSEYGIINGNYIGTDASGLVAIGNSRGISETEAYYFTIGGSTASDRNVISGNERGIHLWSGISQFIIIGNYIGYAADGNSPLGNEKGIFFSANFNNTIGTEESPNYIGFNSVAGIVLYFGIDNILNRNVFNNNGIGIDLDGDGPTQNDEGDVDEGPNHMINSPVFLGDSITENGELVIKYWVDCMNGTASYPLTVDFFQSPDTGSPQGNRYLGADVYYINSWSTGYQYFNLGDTLSLEIHSGDIIVATTTDAAGNTSEFSAGSYVNMGIDDNKALLAYATLSQNIPNPARQNTTIQYSIKKKIDLNLSVYTCSGQKIATLVNQQQQPGDYEIEFNTGNLEAGIYYYSLSDGINSITKKMLIEN